MARIAWVRCGLCGNHEASVTTNAAGTLSVKCHKCEYAGFAKKGSKSARLITAAMTLDEDEKPAEKPAPKSATDTAQASPPPATKKPPSSVFELGNL